MLCIKIYRKAVKFTARVTFRERGGCEIHVARAVKYGMTTVWITAGESKRVSLTLLAISPHYATPRGKGDYANSSSALARSRTRRVAINSHRSNLCTDE